MLYRKLGSSSMQSESHSFHQSRLGSSMLIVLNPSQTFSNPHSNLGRSQGSTFHLFPHIHPDNRSSCQSFSTCLSLYLSTSHLSSSTNKPLSLALSNFRTSTRSPQLPLDYFRHLRFLPPSFSSTTECNKSRTPHSLIREIK